MGVRLRGKSWVVQVYNPVTKQKQHIGTYHSREAAEVVDQEFRRPRRRPAPLPPKPKRVSFYSLLPEGQHVYVVAADELNRVKIGVSGHLKHRFHDLARSAPVPLRFVCCFPGSRTDEEAVHRAFIPYRRHREWFEFSGEIRAWVEELRAAGDTWFPPVHDYVKEAA